jgi:hypothetical protein
MKRVLIYSAALVLSLGTSSSAIVRHVPSEYPTIQAGINAAVNGDTVLVAPGTYTENFSYGGREIVVKSETGPLATILEPMSEATPIASLENGEGPNSTLEGFTVRYALNAPAVNISYSSATLKGNIFQDNTNNYSDGGAVNAVFGEVLTVIDNSFMNNSSDGTGGGIRSYGIRLVATGNQFTGNTAGTHGGAIHLRANNDSQIHHNLFTYNHSLAIGTVTFSECGGGEFYNNTMIGNSNDEPPNGAGIVIWISQNCNVYNNIIANNLGIGLLSNPANGGTALYNDVWGNNVDYNGIIPGPGSISEDPQFVGGQPYSYQLLETSPCIDAGDPAQPYDPDGTVADMGAYYFDQDFTTMSFDIGDVGAAPGQPVSAPIIGAGFGTTQIGGLEFHISYDVTLLTFDGITSTYLQDAQVNSLDGIIHIVWQNVSSPITLPDNEAILSLNFTAIGSDGNTSPLTWQAGSETVDPVGEILGVDYLNGSVSIFVPHSIGGGIVYYDLTRPLADIAVQLSGNSSGLDSTDSGGSYMFAGLAPGAYALSPGRISDDGGVNVLDLALIQRHLAYLERFNLAYKYIAADANGSGNISIADVVKIARYLADLEELPVGNWAFVDASFNIDDQNWHLAPSTRNVNLGNSDISNIDFVGVRIGDVDFSWGTGRMRSSATLLDDPGFYLEEVPGEPGSTVTMNVRAVDTISAAGIEFHIEYAPEYLTVTALNSDMFTDPLVNNAEGVIHLIWCDIDDLISFEDEQIVFGITFAISPDAPQRIPVNFLTSYTVDVNGAELDIDYIGGAVYRSTGIIELVPSEYGLGQNYPNPFNASTVIEFGLPAASQVKIEIFEIAGRKVSTIVDGRFDAGQHRVTWSGTSDDGAELTSGLYFYRLKSADVCISKQMLMLK